MINLVKSKYRVRFYFILCLLFHFSVQSYGQQTGCSGDFDCDGIPDIGDIDADNDGIYNHIESPSCFHTRLEYEEGDRRDMFQTYSNIESAGGTDADVGGMIDGSSTVGYLIKRGQSIVNKTIFQFSTYSVGGIELKSLTITHSLAAALLSPSAKVVLQGSNSGVWIDLTEQISLSNAATTEIIVTKNKKTYNSYRIYGAAGTVFVSADRNITEINLRIEDSFFPSLFMKRSCVEDIRNGGTPNFLNLNSDGDTTFDALEAGFTNVLANGTVGTVIDENGAVVGHNYDLTPLEYYKTSQIDTGKDSDGDGVNDHMDIDIDNDGIYNHVESPACFYQDFSYETGNRRDVYAITTQMSLAEKEYRLGAESMIDGDKTAGVSFAGNTQMGDKEVFKIATKIALGVHLTKLTITQTATALFTAASRMVAQASNDGINWIPLTEELAANTTALSYTYTFTKNLGSYRMYRLYMTSGATFSGTSVKGIAQIEFKTADFNPSLYPIVGCYSDADADGASNFLDLDSDGDGCSDAKEVGFVDIGGGVVGTVSDDLGAVIGHSYKTPENLYYLDSKAVVCTGKGIPIDGQNPHCLDLDQIDNDYDLSQSGYHSTIVRTKQGFSIFGSGNTHPNGVSDLLEPVDISPGGKYNYPYEGEIIDATLGTQGMVSVPKGQYFILSTAGLYVWGAVGTVIHPDMLPNNRINTTQKIELPVGVTPLNVKKINASYGILSVLTKSGDVYIALGNNSNLHSAADYGDGSTVKDAFWHKARISGIVSLKINAFGQVMAKSIDGDVYTWGKNILLGDGSQSFNSDYPLKMKLPDGLKSILMINVTGYAQVSAFNSEATYVVLGEDNRVYTLGSNRAGVLGIGKTYAQINSANTWQTVVAPNGGSGYLEDVKLISSVQHDQGPGLGGAIGVVTKNNALYLWGSNSGSKLGQIATTTTIQVPTTPLGIKPESKIIYVEVGGHVTPIIDQTTGKFGYVGHRINGSMGIPGAEGTIPEYDFTNTPEIDFCNIVVGGAGTEYVPINPILQLHVYDTDEVDEKK